MKPTYMWARCTVDVQRKLTGDYTWSTSSQLYERASRYVKRSLTRGQHHRLCRDMANAEMLIQRINSKGTYEYSFAPHWVLPGWKLNLKMIKRYRVDTSRNGLIKKVTV